MGFVMLVGIGSTLLVPETNGKPLEQISGENDQPIYTSMKIFLSSAYNVLTTRVGVNGRVAIDEETPMMSEPEP